MAGLIGLFMTVLGGVALARLLPTDSITGETATVIGMGFTVVMAVITLLLGLVFLGGAGRPAGARQGLISLGIALLAFGIITFIEPDALGDVLGVTQTSGLVYAILGLIATIAGLVSPTLTTRRAVAERVEADDEVIHVT
jgi:hypothetical protein